MRVISVPFLHCTVLFELPSCANWWHHDEVGDIVLHRNHACGKLTGRPANKTLWRPVSFETIRSLGRWGDSEIPLDFPFSRRGFCRYFFLLFFFPLKMLLRPPEVPSSRGTLLKVTNFVHTAHACFTSPIAKRLDQKNATKRSRA